MDQTLLVHLSGQDQPGVTAALMGHLAAARADVLDVEQITIRERLHLSVLITVPDIADASGSDSPDGPGHGRNSTGGPSRDLLKELLLFGWEHHIHVEFELVGPTALTAVTPGAGRPGALFAVTVVGASLGPAILGAVADAIASGGGNIERITSLARYPVHAYELVISAGDIAAIRAGLVSASRSLRFDVAVQPNGLSRRAIRLVALDVDSTLIQDEVIELLADEAGCGPAVAAITARAMAGELDFESALRERVELLAGLDAAVLDRARARLRLTPGARTFVRTLKRLGFKLAIVSGGFTPFTDALQTELGIDHAYANELEIVDGRLTGRLLGRVIDRRRKAEILAEVAALEGVELAQTVAVGDGANDLDMLAVAGLGVAFNAKPIVRDAADTSLNVPYLDAVLFVLGIRRDEVEAADLQ